MNDYDLLAMYVGDAPEVRIAEDYSCEDCKFIEQDYEVDCCKEHPSMYHDWDMDEDKNFVSVLVCEDFEKK